MKINWMRVIALVVFIVAGSLTAARAQGPSNELLDKYSPSYHFYPSIDPTGLFYLGDTYYLNWGSASSKNLVNWKITEFGLARTRRFGNGGQSAQPRVLSGISGSAVIDWNNTSGFGVNGNPPLVAMQLSDGSMHVAYSNDTAKTWVRAEKLATMQYDAGSYRDPKVFWFEQDKKWVMVMPWCEIQEIRFYSSPNLVDWEYMSKFGPSGAIDGQWECVDFVPLPVDGDKSKIKWMLEVSVQPRNGQYFIGDFDGTNFVMDKAFRQELTYERYMPQGEMLFDFESGIDDWTFEGNAFINNPTIEDGVNGKEGKRSLKADPVGTGKVTSPEFTITKRYLNFLIGGGYFPDEESFNLLVDGKVVRTHTGNAANAHVDWDGWDVTEFIGQKAKVEVVDKRSSPSWLAKAYIYIDAIMLSDYLPKPTDEAYNKGWEKAFWVDWGLDYYAVRAWANLAPGDDRTLWAGWMGSWKYFNEPVRGNFSVIRSLSLKTFPEGIRLVQQPIKEMQSLRTNHKSAGENTFEGVWTPKKFAPSKNSYELIVEFENISAYEFGLKVGVGENEKTIIGYSPSKEEVYVDRRNSGYDDFSAIFPDISRGPLKQRSKTTTLHIFVDKCSIEVFGNDGEMVMSNKFYPSEKSLGIEVFSNQGKVKVKSLEIWELAAIDIYK